jgi:solute carrier family 8 (sodium/calcium exchanger)
MIRTEALS